MDVPVALTRLLFTRKRNNHRLPILAWVAACFVLYLGRCDHLQAQRIQFAPQPARTQQLIWLQHLPGSSRLVASIRPEFS